MNTLALAGQVLVPEGSFLERTVRIQGKKIAAVESTADRRADILASGWIVPGFIDLQVNGGYGFDVTADPSSTVSLAARLPQTGVTSFLPTIITSPIETYSRRLPVLDRAAREAREAHGAAVLGVHLEGPYLSPQRAGAHNPASLRPPSIEEFEKDLFSPSVRLVTLAPELPGALDLIHHLRTRGIVVSAGHSNANYEQAVAAFRAGVTWGTHLFNAMPPLEHRAPGLAGAFLSSDVPCGLIADGIHAHPATVHLAWRAKGARGITLVTDAMAAMGMPAGRYALGDRDIIVDGASARLASGTLAGSLLQMDTAVRNIVEFAGASLAKAVTAASTTPARVLGLETGQLAAGYAADIVVLDQSLQVELTIVKGNVVYQRR